MLDDAALALEEIEPEDRHEPRFLEHVLLSTSRRRNGKWPQRLRATSRSLSLKAPGGGSVSPMRSYGSESIEKAGGHSVRAQAILPKVAMISFNFACYASVKAARMRQKNAWRVPSSLTKTFADWRSTIRIWSFYGIWIARFE